MWFTLSLDSQGNSTKQNHPNYKSGGLTSSSWLLWNTILAATFERTSIPIHKQKDTEYYKEDNPELGYILFTSKITKNVVITAWKYMRCGPLISLFGSLREKANSKGLGPGAVWERDSWWKGQGHKRLKARACRRLEASILRCDWTLVFEKACGEWGRDSCGELYP